MHHAAIDFCQCIIAVIGKHRPFKKTNRNRHFVADTALLAALDGPVDAPDFAQLSDHFMRDSKIAADFDV